MTYDHDQEILREFGEEDARLIDLAKGLYNAICQYHRADRAVATESGHRQMAWIRTREAWAASAQLTLNEIRRAK